MTMTEHTVDDRPKYERVTDELARRARELAAHTALPAERELMHELGVSRMTVRKAIERLVRRGLVYQVQGSGTFVADPEMVTKTLQLTSFTEDMMRRGLQASTSVLSTQVVAASVEVARRLDIDAGTEVFTLDRLRLADEQPMALESVHLAPLGVDWTDLDPAGSLYAQLETAGVSVARAAQTIDAVNLDREQAHALDQPIAAAAMRVTRVSYTATGRPTELAQTIYRGDRYSFDVVISRDAG